MAIPRNTITVQPSTERAILVGVTKKGAHHDDMPVEDSLEELMRLAETAGAEVVGSIRQQLNRPTTRFYLGEGKMKELAELRNEAGYTMVIFDNELSPLQQRNIEDILQVKVIDRTALIIDIFARRARSHEGQLQVELAQHKYLLPRLAGQWSHLERLGGGIGTRGPGESQIETDRRLIRNRIHRLKKEIEQIRRHRALYRYQREKRGIPVIAIVGYTNAGKSTLFNALSKAEVLVEDKLFATLDPTTRRLLLPDRREVLLTDTVGFIQKLPAALVAAFRATLEELEQANLLLHVVDLNHPNATQQSEIVENTLKDLGLSDKPQILVLNKIDLLPQSMRSNLGNKEIARAQRAGTEKQHVVPISAVRGWGLKELMGMIAGVLDRKQ